MKGNTRLKKENSIIEAAEKVFASVGFKNARMEDIAAEANITKVTLYTYFQSKENLYMALTYKALVQLKDRYDNILSTSSKKPGLESVILLLQGFMDFCEENFLYSELMLEYFAIVRSTSHNNEHMKLTDALKNSSYFFLLQEIHNYPFKICAKEIQRGINDKSIKVGIDPMFHTLHGWTAIIGYVKLLAVSGNIANPLFNINLKDLKSFNLDITRKILSNN